MDPVIKARRKCRNVVQEAAPARAPSGRIAMASYVECDDAITPGREVPGEWRELRGSAAPAMNADDRGTRPQLPCRQATRSAAQGKCCCEGLGLV